MKDENLSNENIQSIDSYLVELQKLVPLIDIIYASTVFETRDLKLRMNMRDGNNITWCINRKDLVECQLGPLFVIKKAVERMFMEYKNETGIDVFQYIQSTHGSTKGVFE